MNHPPSPLLAQITGINDISPNFPNNSNSQLIGLFVSRFLPYSIALAGLYFLYKLIVAGYIYLTSMADPAKIQTAFKEIQHAIIGLLIVVSAFFMTQIVQYIFSINIL